MISSKKKPTQQPDDTHDREENIELPPLDGGDSVEVEEDEVVSYIDIVGEGDAPLVVDGEERSGEEGVTGLDDTFEPEGVSWIEGETEPSEIDVEMGLESDDKEWTEDPTHPDEQLDSESGWLLNEYDGEPDEEDDGAEAALDRDAIDFDQKRWEDMKDLDTEDDDSVDLSEPPLDPICEEIEKNVEEEDSDVDAEFGMGTTLESQFLGPEKYDVIDVVMIDGIPMAAGDDLFVIGADGMLHGLQIPETIAALSITSVCEHGGAIFVGTEKGGALVTRDLGSTFQSINGWYTLGLTGSDKGSDRRMSVDFFVAGQLTSRGYRLFGRTGGGQLFCSLDNGVSWRGTLTAGHCVAAAPSVGTDDLFAVCRSEDRVHLFKSSDLLRWEDVEIPERLIDLASQGAVRIAACMDTIAIAVDDPSEPLFFSLDKGATWTGLDIVTGVTAVALDPENPGCIAVALYQEQTDLGVVRMTEDGGMSWQTVLVAGESEETGAVESGRGRQGGRVRNLIIDTSHTRQIVVVTAGGVYKVELARASISH